MIVALPEEQVTAGVARAITLTMLEMMRDAVGPEPPCGFAYRGPSDFMLQHGQWYEPVLRPEETPEGPPKLCYANAIMLCVLHPTWRYVEGWAVIPRVCVPVMHAWNVTPSDLLVDSTWRNAGLCYFGVEFSVGRADDASWNGDANVLDDARRGWPILRERWNGEDWSREWPDTEAMRITRLVAALNPPAYEIPPGRLRGAPCQAANVVVK